MRLIDTNDLRKAAQVVYLVTDKNLGNVISSKLNKAATVIDELQDLVVWMTGCGYDFCQHKYFRDKVDELLEIYSDLEKNQVEDVKSLYAMGTVCRVEESTYDYADVYEENYNSILTIPLLEFEGKRVEVTVKVIEKEILNGQVK